MKYGNKINSMHSTSVYGVQSRIKIIGFKQCVHNTIIASFVLFLFNQSINVDFRKPIHNPLQIRLVNADYGNGNSNEN